MIAWSTAEIDLIRAHYPTGGAADVRWRLPVARTAQAINEKARRIGVKKAYHKRYQRYAQSDTIDAAIRRAYQAGRRGAVKELAENLGREYGWIKYRAAVLGLTRPAKRAPNWTPAEDALLESLEGKSLDYLHKRLRRAGFNRSLAAIQGRAYRLSLSFDDPDTLTAHAVAQLLGVDSHTPLRWIRNGKLPARQYRQSTVEGDPKFWRIKRKDLRNFIRDYPTEIDLRKANQPLLLELLLGAPKAWERESAA